MKSLYKITVSFLFFPVILHAGSVSSIDHSTVYQVFEKLKQKPAAKILHDNGWSVVAMKENGNRVYWFLAPDENNASPALIKKTVNDADRNTHETVIVSECKAPKKTCDDLMKQFKTMSVNYK